jgi:serine protease
VAKGVVIVAAAGNSGKSIGWPAKYPGVIAVGATDSKDDIAWFSSRGPELAIAAPGVKVIQQTICDGGRNACEQFGAFSGTSMASPHVAGAAALLVGLGVSDADHVRAALTSTARAKGEPEKYGAGVLDIGAATSHTYLMHVLLRLVSLVVLALGLRSYIKGKKGEFNVGPGALFASLFAGVGLLAFGPFVHLASVMRGPTRTALELAMRPFGEWDQLLGTGLHHWLPLAGILPVAALVMIAFKSDRLRPTIGGFALGTAALCSQIAISADNAAPFGSVALRVWMGVNILLCLGVARLALDAKTRA